VGRSTGVGVLAVRTGTRWRSPLPADERERGRVPGFQNVPAAVAAAAALRAVRAEAAVENARLSALVDRIRAEVAARVPDVEVVGPAPAGCRTWSRSPACTSTARRCCTSWTGTVSPSPADRRAPRRR
jgi:cysteine sulfinate desulfinase/cysteine desulfurase-like protein